MFKISQILFLLLFLFCSKQYINIKLMESVWMYAGIINKEGDVIDFRNYFVCNESEMIYFAIKKENNKYLIIGENHWDINGEILIKGDFIQYTKKYWSSGVYSPPACAFPRDNYLNMLINAIEDGVVADRHFDLFDL